MNAYALRHALDKNRNTLLTAFLFVVLFSTVNGVLSGSFTYFDLRTTVGTGGTLALAAMGQTLVVLSGGFDLSAGAIISLVNVFAATYMGDAITSQILVGLFCLLLGGLAGAFNGFFIAYMRIQPIVVTLATLFIIQGVALLVRPTPGGYIPPSFMSFMAGDAIPGVLPSALVVILLALLAWFILKNSRLGAAIYALGSDESAAMAAGVRTRRTKFLSYVLAGLYYSLAGLFISAQSGGSDPLVGAPMLLQIFAAVVLGGTLLGGGQGGLVGSLIGAYLLMLFVNLLLVFSLPTFLSPIADGAVLLLAVIVGAIGSRDSVLHNAAEIVRQIRGRAGHSLKMARSPLPRAAAGDVPKIGWFTRHREAMMLAIPAYSACAVIIIATALYFGGLTPSYLTSLLILSAFLGILAFGQATVILSGGLDLSIPWTITLCSALFAGFSSGEDLNLWWAVPAVLACGAAIGMTNGIGVSVFGLQPIVMTLAANGILQGLTLYYTQGSPSGFAPPLLTWFVSGKIFGAQPAVWFFGFFILAGVFLLGSTTLGRRIYAIGNNPTVSHFSGIDVRATRICAYTISGLCAACVAILLVGFNGAANLGMGDEYLLPSIAVVVAGGVLITGGRGHYLGVVGGVVLLISLQILIGGTTLPDAVRGIIFGFVMLGALLALQDRKPG